jgi:uncharacterized membrane protein HdeD (DUF308 family)
MQWFSLALVFGGVLVTVYGFATRREQGWSQMWIGASVTANAMSFTLIGAGARPPGIVCLFAAGAFLAASLAAMIVRRRAQRRAS